MSGENVIDEGTFFIKDVKSIDLCGSTMYHLTGSNYSKPKDFIRLSYPDHNLENCPNCKKRYENAIEVASQKYNAFPACCAPHRRLFTAPWFNRADFENFPKLYADKLLHSWHHILHHISKDGWKDEIFDFCEYIIKSFGSFPEGYGEALCMGMFIHDLKGLVSTLTEHLDRKKEILKFIDDCYDPKPNNKADLTILATTYNEWYKTFPFELSFLSHLKIHFQKNIPFLKSMHTNKYMGLTKGTMRTNENLVALLIKVTEKVITQINTLNLFESGEIFDLEKVQLELILQERKQKLKEGYNNTSKDPSTRYRRILKAWLKDEIAFIKKLRPIAEQISKRVALLHDSLLQACGKMQENKVFYDADENTRTKQILDLLPKDFFTKDQSMYGLSETGKKQGSVDGVITDKNNIEYFLEAFNLSSIQNEIISRHIQKLESNYDSKGLRTKYLLVYCNIKDGTFETFSNAYREFLQSKMVFKFYLTSLTEEETKFTNIRLLKSMHIREGKPVILYHVLIKMPIKE
ncbi:MAG: hypothetical protein JNM88_18665 [Chitinophagaceae bacterium]|nr:hypothetical protein [Chitinophagaceae bacterium]